MVLLTPYAALGARHKSRLLLLLLLVASSMAPAFAFNAHDKAEAAVEQQMKRSGSWDKLQPEQRQNVLKSMKVLAPVSAGFKRLFYIGFISLLCWFLLRGFSDEIRLWWLVAAVSTACVPLLLRDGLATWVFLATDPSTVDLEHPVKASIGALLSRDTQATLKVLLSRLDVFTLWVSGLVAVGVNQVCGTKSRLPWMVVIGVWLLGTAVELLGSL